MRNNYNEDQIETPTHTQINIWKQFSFSFGITQVLLRGGYLYTQVWNQNQSVIHSFIYLFIYFFWYDYKLKHSLEKNILQQSRCNTASSKYIQYFTFCLKYMNFLASIFYLSLFLDEIFSTIIIIINFDK